MASREERELAQIASNANAHLLPKLRASSVSAVMLPEDVEAVDVKLAIELGFTLLLDKPVVLIVEPGSAVPSRLAKVADAIVEGPIDAPDFRGRLKAALERIPEEE